MKRANDIAVSLALAALIAVVCSSAARADEGHVNALYFAIQNEDVEKARTALTADPKAANTQGGDHNYSYLHFAVGHPSKKGVEILKMLLTSKANVNAKAEYDRTPLHFSAASGNTDAAKLLIEYGAAVNARQRDGKTPLHLAATNGHIDLVELLLENMAEVAAKDHYKNTPLICAVVAKQKEIVKLLRQHGAME